MSPFIWRFGKGNIVRKENRLVVSNYGGTRKEQHKGTNLYIDYSGSNTTVCLSQNSRNEKKNVNFSICK